MTNSLSGELHTVESYLAVRVEAKVKAASTAAAIAGVLVSLLGAYVFRGGVPEWAQAMIGAAVTGALAFVGGWLAKHTPRPAPTPTQPQVTPLATPGEPPATPPSKA